MAEVNPQQLRDLGAGNPDLYRYDDDPAIQARQLQDLWMQLRGPQGYQMRPATPDNFPAPLDLSSLLRQLVQMASTPGHPDQQAALRHLVLMHSALGRQQGMQVAGDVVPGPSSWQGAPVKPTIVLPSGQLPQTQGIIQGQPIIKRIPPTG